MTVVLTMAGAGSRFARVGYTVPKHEIEFRGHTLLDWSLASLLGMRDQPLVVVTQPHDDVEQVVRDASARLGFAQPTIVLVDRLTRGQAESAMLAADYVDATAPFIVYNTDTYTRPDALSVDTVAADGWIPCFSADGDRWSFVAVDDTGAATEVTEKVRVSDNCSLGLYYFSSFDLYRNAYEEHAAVTTDELYIAPLYNRLIADGRRVEIASLDREDVCVLGTPEDLALAPDDLTFPAIRYLGQPRSDYE